MKTLVRLAAVASIFVLAVPAFASRSQKCGKSAQACLDAFAKMHDAGYDGLQFDKNDKGETTVVGIVESSPASKAGFQVGDVLTAMNGVKLSDKKAFEKAYLDRKVGAQVTYTVMRNNAEQQIPVTLEAMPEAVFVQMVGDHMIHDHMSPGSTMKAENTSKTENTTK